MQPASLDAIARRADGEVVIELRGDIDGAARDALNEAYLAAAGNDPLTLDFAAVDYINSTGIALIVGMLARARAEARPVTAVGLSAHYREIFEITRLSDFMRIVVDEPDPHTDQHGAAT